MKWLFFALLLVNVGLAAFQWVKHREQDVLPEFVDDVAVEKIVLLSDGLMSANLVGGSRCALLGPLDGVVDIESIRQKIDHLNDFVRVVEQKIEKAPSYWVYLPANTYSKDGVVLLKKIGLEGYKISSGSLAGAFSLGVFENIDLARKLVKKVKSQGQKAEIKEKSRHDLSLWLEYSLQYATENQDKMRELQSFLPKGLKKREIFCKSVASGK